MLFEYKNIILYLDVIADLEEEAHLLEWHQRRIKRKIALAQQLKQENEDSKRKISELETKPAHLTEEKIMLIEQVKTNLKVHLLKLNCSQWH